VQRYKKFYYLNFDFSTSPQPPPKEGEFPLQQVPSPSERAEGEVLYSGDCGLNPQ